MISYYLQRAWSAVVAATATRERTTVAEGGLLVGPRVVRILSHRSWVGAPMVTGVPEPAPIAVVWHYTATDPGTAAAMARRRTRPRTSEDKTTNWHFTVASNGKIWQHIPLTRQGWHCRDGQISGHVPNRCAVGIELEGWGDVWPQAQIDAAEDVARAIAEAYDLDRRAMSWLHSELAPKRKPDPGPIWAGQVLPGLLDRIGV